LEGLPKAWQKLLKTTITEDEQNENPDAGRFMTFLTYMSPVCMSHMIFYFFVSSYDEEE
jgi:hypothetical protein